MRSGRASSSVRTAVVLALALAACSSGGSGHTAGTRVSAPQVTSTTRLAAGAVPARPSKGCRAPAAERVTPGEYTFAVNRLRVDRYYIAHVPPGYRPSTPMPLVVDLHGYMVGAKIETQVTGLGAYGDTHGFLTVTPQGSGNPKFVTWNTSFRSADTAVIGDLLDGAEGSLCIDTRRVFVAGYSQGAFMASTLACLYADRVAAVAAVAGIRDAPGCDPARPVPVVAFHGTADPDIAYTGGLGPAGLGLPAFDGSGKTMGEEGLQHRPPLNGAAIPVISSAWAERNGCDPRPVAHTVARDVTRLAWTCPAGAEVELYRISGGGHTWPGSAFTAAVASILGRTTMSISADAVMWRFFQAHPLRDP